MVPGLTAAYAAIRMGVLLAFAFNEPVQVVLIPCDARSTSNALSKPFRPQIFKEGGTGGSVPWSQIFGKHRLTFLLHTKAVACRAAPHQNRHPHPRAGGGVLSS